MQKNNPKFTNTLSNTLLNYSLLDSSLNIKLELTNKESKEKQDKATMQREQKQHKIGRAHV